MIKLRNTLKFFYLLEKREIPLIKERILEQDIEYELTWETSASRSPVGVPCSQVQPTFALTKH